MKRTALALFLLPSLISLHCAKSFEIRDYDEDFYTPSEESSMVMVPSRLDYLYKKRMKNVEFFGVFLAVTGIPILWALSTLFFTSPPNEQKKSQSISNGWPTATMVDEGSDLDIISEKIAITKDVIRLASQSLNLVSHTVDLFNILTGRGSGGGEGDDGGGGSELKGKGEIARKGQLPEKNSTVQFLTKALRLSTSTLAFILEILSY